MDPSSRRLFPRWPPLLVMFLAAAYLTVRWDSIPARWVIHWGPRGDPNGWATRTVPGVYGLLALAAAVVVVNEAVAAIRRGGAVVIEPMRVVVFGVTVMLSLLAIDLPLGPPLPLPALLVLCVAPVIVALVTGGIRLGAALRDLREKGDGAKIEGYHALHYANANDRRLWVPKRSGMGWTINFSHPLAWPMLLLLLAMPIAAIVSSLGR
jgi:uncharacterized membrane protein